jgi:hypothetical protein
MATLPRAFPPRGNVTEQNRIPLLLIEAGQPCETEYRDLG